MSYEKPLQFSNPSSNSSETIVLAAKEQSSLAQKARLRFSVQAGKQIQLRYPQIAQEFLDGASFLDLVKKYNIQNELGLTSANTAESAVRFALVGFEAKPGVRDMESYSGLIEDKEVYKNAAKKHQQNQGATTGRLTQKEGSGIFAMTAEERSEVGRKSGTALFERKVGVHCVSLEQKMAYGRKAAIANGLKPFSEEEILLIKKLALLDTFRRGIKIDAKKITEKVNQELHEGNQIRKSRQISKFLYKTRKRNFSQE